MKRMLSLGRLELLCTSLLVGLFTQANAGPHSGPLVLLELFTSQGCYSCPPAEKLLASEFIDKPGVLALEMHVDYWDSLVYKGSSWKDPFSKEQFSARQRRYAQHSRRTPFTPQMVIAGAYFTSGTNSNGINHAIGKINDLDIAAPWEFDFAVKQGSWQVVMSDPIPERDVEVLTVIYRKMTTTVIEGGENKGKELANHNVVLELVNHGLAEAGRSYQIGTTELGDSCAVILQRTGQGPIRGVWPCEAVSNPS